MLKDANNKYNAHSGHYANGVQVVCARTNANNAKSIGPAITQDAKYSEK